MSNGTVDHLVKMANDIATISGPNPTTRWR